MSGGKPSKDFAAEVRIGLVLDDLSPDGNIGELLRKEAKARLIPIVSGGP